MDDDAIAELAKRLGGNGGAKRTQPYSVKEAAKALGVSVSHLSERVQAGRIPRVPNLGTIRIPARTINRMLEAEISQ